MQQGEEGEMVVASPSPQLSKNEQIKATMKATREKRKHQDCRVYQLKVDKSKLSREAQTHLWQLFLQAKWYVNAILGSDDIFSFDYKTTEVPVKVGDTFEVRSLTVLSSQMRQ